MCVLLLALLSQTQPSPEFRSAGNSAEVWRHRLRGRLKIIADPVSDFKNRSWTRQSSGADAIWQIFFELDFSKQPPANC